MANVIFSLAVASPHCIYHAYVIGILYNFPCRFLLPKKNNFMLSKLVDFINYLVEGFLFILAAPLFMMLF